MELSAVKNCFVLCGWWKQQVWLPITLQCHDIGNFAPYSSLNSGVILAKGLMLVLRVCREQQTLFLRSPGYSHVCRKMWEGRCYMLAALDGWMCKLCKIYTAIGGNGMWIPCGSFRPFYKEYWSNNDELACKSQQSNHTFPNKKNF